MSAVKAPPFRDGDETALQKCTCFYRSVVIYCVYESTRRLVDQYDGFCIEDLPVKGLARTKLAKSIHDAALGEFRRQLEYKTLWARKPIAIISRWFPSSKMCRACGTLNDALTLSDRHWMCDCGAIHNRDLNAAENIRREGLKQLAAGQAESLNACGAGVRLIGAIGDEARIPPALAVGSVNPSQTAFLVPLEGQTSNQAAFQSEDFLKQAQVATKRIQIPQNILKGETRTCCSVGIFHVQSLRTRLC